jgi:LuxR family transcriptional regulator
MMRSATTVYDLRCATLAFVHEFGFRSAYFMSPIAGDPRLGRNLTNAGFSQAWARSYRSGLYRSDPLPRIALHHSRPFRWGALLRTGYLQEQGKRYLKTLEQHDMADGLVVPAYGPGVRCGLMGLGHADDLDSYTEDDIALIQMGTQASYNLYCDLISVELEEVLLSNREIDVLYWIMQGKSNSAIAGILGISTQTVDTYVRRLFAKLGVADRTGAAIAAIQRGIFVAGYLREDAEQAPAD